PSTERSENSTGPEGPFWPNPIDDRQSITASARPAINLRFSLNIYTPLSFVTILPLARQKQFGVFGESSKNDDVTLDVAFGPCVGIFFMPARALPPIPKAPGPRRHKPPRARRGNHPTCPGH